MSGKDYSGWGGDDKGAPMVVVAPEGGGGSSGGGRMTVILLVVALVFALGIAGYGMVRLSAADQANKTAMAALEKTYQEKIRVLNTDLGSAKADAKSADDYINSLKSDNLALAKNRREAMRFDPPQAPWRQQYIDALKDENRKRRAGVAVSAPAAPPQGQDPRLVPR